MDLPARADRAGEIRWLLAVKTTLLDAVREAQRRQSEQLGCATAASRDLAAGIDDLGRTLEKGFADLTVRIEHITQLVRRLGAED
ncbi:hypothetical protein ACWEVP_11995 [Amycolatopsis sp. NPDC003865]